MRSIVFLACCVSFVFAISRKPILPSIDDFYDTPDDISKYNIGAVIRHRQAPAPIGGLRHPLNVRKSWQFLVRTTDHNDKPSAIVTTVIEPYDAYPEMLLSYQFAEDSASLDCAPSYSILLGAKKNTFVSQLEMYAIKLALSNGWYVVIPDYLGPNSAFSMSQLAGRATLDSIRAVLQTEEITKIKQTAQVALWGYSGGSIPTSWAAILQPAYAPELSGNLVGAAFGGWLTNMTSAIERMDGTIVAGLIPLVINGLLNENVNLTQHLLSYIVDAKDRVKFVKAGQMCLAEAYVNFAFKNFFEGEPRFFLVGEQVLRIPEVRQIIDSNVIGLSADQGVPQIPLFVYQGMEDEIIPYEQTERVFKKFCDLGVKSIELALAENTGHFGEMVQGTGAALAWIKDRMSFIPVTTGCVRKTRVTNLEYEGADRRFYELLKASWENILGRELGRFRVKMMPKSAEITFSAMKKLFKTIGPIRI